MQKSSLGGDELINIDDHHNQSKEDALSDNSAAVLNQKIKQMKAREQ